MKSLSLKEFKKFQPHALILDFRVQDLFDRGFIPGSLFCGLHAPQHFCLDLVEKDRKTLLVCPENQEQECLALLQKHGFNQVKGYLEGGFESWAKAGNPIDMIISITPEEFLADLNYLSDSEHILDLRTTEEFEESALPQSKSMPLSEIEEQCTSLNPQDTYYLYCSGGYRSVIAASILRKRGFYALKNIYGGYARIKAEQKTQL